MSDSMGDSRQIEEPIRLTLVSRIDPEAWREVLEAQAEEEAAAILAREWEEWAAKEAARILAREREEWAAKEAAATLARERARQSGP